MPRPVDRRGGVDPEMAAILESLPGGGEPFSVEVARRPSPAARLKGPPEPVEAVEDLSIDGPGGPLALRLYRPGGPPPPLLVFFHGGGWVIGDLEIQDGLCRAVANRAGCAVLSVDYRLAPEHPFPAAADDAWAACRWAAACGADLGVDADRLGVAGDSAGGNLALGVALRARDAGAPGLRLCLLTCPVVDHRLDDASMADCAEGYFLTRAKMAWYWDQYAPAGTDRSRPELSPLRADLAGLCPTVVVTAGFDPLRDQGLDLARACAAAGVDTISMHLGGMIHGFLGFSTSVSRSRAALAELGELVRQRFG